jgi:hypothetical protein
VQLLTLPERISYSGFRQSIVHWRQQASRFVFCRLPAGVSYEECALVTKELLVGGGRYELVVPKSLDADDASSNAGRVLQILQRLAAVGLVLCHKEVRGSTATSSQRILCYDLSTSTFQ